ncbi:hypothetical protein A9Q99_25965 [Gammaproteobacteria bacterium 45_16_T64]|nr:hypothetical protein A9Q99_25965 [Gammaproteobacteria bacterium 45_16_T64]
MLKTRSNKFSTLSVKISAAILAALFISFAVIYFFIISYFEKYVYTRANVEIENQISFVSQQLDDRHHEIVDIGSIISSEPTIRRSLHLLSSRGISQAINRLVAIYPFLNYVVLVDDQMEVFAASTRDSSGDRVPGENLIGMNVNDILMLSGSLLDHVSSLSPSEDVWLGDFDMQQSTTQLFISPVKHGEEVIGWMVVSYDWYEQVSLLLDSIRLQLIGSGNPIVSLSINDEKKVLVKSVSDEGDIESINVLSSVVPLSFVGKGVELKLEFNEDKVTKIVTQTSQLMLAFFLVSGVIIFVVIYAVISKYVLARINTIHQASLAVQEGTLGNHIPIDGDDELSQLAESFNKMNTSLADIASMASDISQGDFSERITPRGANDALGLALYSMTEMLAEVTDVCRGISVGDYSRKVILKSDNDLLGEAINRMVDNFINIVSQANAIAQGNYRMKITPSSDEDALGNALYEMTSQIRDNAEENERAQWLKTGVAGLYEIIRGEERVTELSTKVIAYLTKYFGARVGVMYTSGDSASLQLTGSYAYSGTSALETVKYGEGLVGQSALDKEVILAEDFPEGHLSINSALVGCKPMCILVNPFITGDTVKGVLEIGSLYPFNDEQRKLLNLVSETVAMAIQSCQDRVQLTLLLQDTQRQSLELKSQQESLSSANENLIEQALKLKSSEEELTQQSEELRVANEELQVTNEELEEKQEALRRQKKDLEKAKKTLTKSAEELSQASRYKSEFLANMSHELRTPLNSLLILSRGLSKNKEGNLTESQKQDAKIIYEGGHDLLNLINDIMDLSKVEAGMLNVNYEDVQFQNVLDNLSTLFGSVARETGIDFRSTIDDGLSQSIVSDEQRLLQILKNFLSNAFKFTKQGTVTVRIHKPDEATIFSKSGLSLSTSVAFSVTDSGIGIPKDKQKAIFAAFQQADGTTSREYGGTGLGLAISTELASLLEGEIGLHSEPGNGSTFTLYLPSKNERSKDESATPLPKAGAELGGGRSEDLGESVSPASMQSSSFGDVFIADDRSAISQKGDAILIIEDDVNFVNILLDLAREAQFKCIVTNKGREGLYLAMEYLPRGILLDAGLPDVDGLVVLEQLKHNPETYHIPIHVISGRDSKQDYLDQGALTFLSKPSGQEDIMAIFSELSKTNTYNSITILLIEDDKSHQKAVSQLLESETVRVISASTGEEALGVLEKQTIDGIILDLGLPDMSGEELLERIHVLPAYSDIPVIVYTGQTISDNQKLALSSVTADIIIKGSSSPERLLADVNLFLNSVGKKHTSGSGNEIAMLHDADSMLKDRRILLVDDDMRNLFALSKQLQSEGLSVVMADNGQAALDRLEETIVDGATNNPSIGTAKLPAVELIIMDIMMPTMDGYEAMRRIRRMREYAEVPIIALTAKAMPEDRQKCIDAGASEFLTKPVDTDRLISMLRVWLYRPNDKN